MFWRIKTVWANLVESFVGTFVLNYLEFGPTVQKLFKDFFSIFCSGGHFV